MTAFTYYQIATYSVTDHYGWINSYNLHFRMLHNSHICITLNDRRIIDLLYKPGDPQSSYCFCLMLIKSQNTNIMELKLIVFCSFVNCYKSSALINLLQCSFLTQIKTGSTVIIADCWTPEFHLTLLYELIDWQHKVKQWNKNLRPNLDSRLLFTMPVVGNTFMFALQATETNLLNNLNRNPFFLLCKMTI